MAYQVNFCETKEQLKHLAEVVTGKAEGSPTGADIDTSTLAYAGLVRDTLPELLSKLGWYSVGEWSTDPLISNDNQYVLYNGIRYVPLSTPYQVNSTTNPDPELLVGTDLKVITDVTDGDLTSSQEELLPPGSQVFPEVGTLENGQTVTAGTTHLRVLVGGKPTIVAMSPVASGVVSLLTSNTATIGSTDTYLLTLVQYEQFTSGNIDLKDWGVVADDSTDNSAALLFMRAVVKTNPAIRWKIKHRDCNLIVTNAVVSYTSNWWLGGIKEFIAKKLRLRCTSNSPYSYLKAVLSSRDCFSVGSDTGNTREIGELIESASVGDTYVTLSNIPSASKFRVGSSVLIGGLNSQVGGWPPNFKRFDYATIKSVNINTGEIELFESLENDYDSTWPDWSAAEGDSSAPRIIPFTKYQSDGWLSDVQANEYAEFDKCVFEPNPNGISAFNFTSLIRIVTDCITDTGEAYYCAQNAKFCKTTRLVTTGSPYGLVYEMDKISKECVIEQPNRAWLDAATGLENLTVKGGSISRSIISPRRMTFENTDLTEVSVVQQYPQGFAIRRADYFGCTLSDLTKTNQIVTVHERETVSSGDWASEGNGEIRLLYSQIPLATFVDLVSYSESGVLVLFTSSGTQDAGIVSGFRFDGNDIILTLDGTEQYSSFNSASNLKFFNCDAEFSGCSFPNAGPMQAVGKIPFGLSGSYGRKEKSTTVVTQRDIGNSNAVNLTSCKRIKEIRLTVTRAYSGSDSPGIRFVNIGGGTGATSPVLTLTTAATGTFVFNESTDPTFFERIIENLRIYRTSNPSGDWDDPVLGPRLMMEIDFVPVV